MANERKAVVGRAAELAAVGDCADTDALVLLRGPGGIGRSTLLAEFARTARERGIRVIMLPCVADEERWDLFRVKAITEFFRNSFAEFGSPKVLESLAAINRSYGPAAYESTRSRIALFAELVRLFEHVRAEGPLVVLVDDVHTAARPVLAVAAARRAGCTVIATSRTDGVVVSGPAALSGLADQVVDLGPMSADEIGELLNRAAGGRLDVAVAPAVRAALGSLAGHPAAALTLLDQVRREGGLTDVLGRLSLRERSLATALPADHDLVRHITGLGDVAVRLVALVAEEAWFGVDELPLFAEAFGYGLADSGTAVDRLVAAGVLRCADDGVLSPVSPALVNAVVRTLGTEGLVTVRRTFAAHLLRSGSARPAVLAGHVARAGTALSPDAALVPVLDREAARLLRVDPALSAHWYRAALWHCPAGSPDHERLLSMVLHLLVRVGNHELLAEVVEEAVTAGAGSRYELAAAAALASVHLGRPLPAAVHGTLAGYAETRAPLAFAARWFAGTPMRVTDVAAAFAEFRIDPCAVVDVAEIEAIRAADDHHDVVAMFRLVLGDEYGEPTSGPLAIYTRLLRDYLAGNWQSITSDARRLELDAAPRVAIHDAARLLTAEVLSSTDHKNATRWLDLVDEDCALPALRAWTEIGLLYRAVGWNEAAELGWAAYDRVREEAELDNTVGLRWFLARMGYLAWTIGDTCALARVYAETERWHARFGGSGMRATERIVRALAERDGTAAAEAVELLRGGESQAELMRACVTAAYVGDDPGTWYQEALSIAKRLGEGWMDAHIRRMMREIGMAPPRARAARDDFSDVELRIIALVKQGRTNRQIATAVRMSEKTVENYLTRLFSRTGCRTRLDLAAASLEGRLVAQP